MSKDRLAQIGERLVAGDPSASEELFLALRALPTNGGESADDSAAPVPFRFGRRRPVGLGRHLASARRAGGRVGGRLRDEPGLRAFLVRLTLNRFIDFYRRHRPSMTREQRLSPDDESFLPAARGDRPSEVAQADDLWARLLSVCPPSHHDMIRMKTLGTSLAEIAERTGFHREQRPPHPLRPRRPSRRRRARSPTLLTRDHGTGHGGRPPTDGPNRTLVRTPLSSAKRFKVPCSAARRAR